MNDPLAERCAGLLSHARHVLVFTGAGISTPSGIPDFRGPQGVWTRRRPVYYQQFVSSEEARVEYWDYKLEGYAAFRDARPNAAHRALVELERLGRLETLVTQNVDGLHEAAGHSPDRIVELHGTNRRVACLDCRRDADSAAVFDSFRRTRRPPRCACGGLLKPATVMFGEQMPAEPFRRALAAAETADFVLSVGSTLEVEPAASVPLSAARRGVPYVLLNQGPTAHDRFATLRLEGDAALLLPAIVDRLKEHLG